MSPAHDSAALCPQPLAIKLILWVKGIPTFLMALKTLLCKAEESLPDIILKTLANKALRTVVTTLKVKSTCALSSPFNTLNQILRLMQRFFKANSFAR